jgi:hypothetical protein
VRLPKGGPWQIEAREAASRMLWQRTGNERLRLDKTSLGEEWLPHSEAGRGMLSSETRVFCVRKTSDKHRLFIAANGQVLKASEWEKWNHVQGLGDRDCAWRFRGGG